MKVAELSGSPDRRKWNALRRHPHHHAATAVKIYTDNLPTLVSLSHRGLLVQ